MDGGRLADREKEGGLMQALWLGPVVVGQLSSFSCTSSSPLALKTSPLPLSPCFLAPLTSFFPPAPILQSHSARPLLFSGGSDNLLDLNAILALI